MLGRCGSTFSDEQLAIVEALAPRIAVAREHVHERIVDENREISVRDRAGYREMVASDEDGDLVWSRAALDEPERSGWFYIDLLHLAAVRASHRRRFLFIGSGGGVSIRQFARVYPGAKLEVVESDERVVMLARRWFGLDAVPNLSMMVADGAAFLRSAPIETWDAIIIDAYDGSKLSRPFASRAFFADVRRTLRTGGGLAFNVIGSLGGSSDVQGIERAARAERLEVRLVPVLDPGEGYSPMAVRNVVLLGRR
jgi:spermidine synthase